LIPRCLKVCPSDSPEWTPKQLIIVVGGGSAFTQQAKAVAVLEAVQPMPDGGSQGNLVQMKRKNA